MDQDHEIRRLWLRPEPGGPVVEQAQLEVEGGQGVVGDHTYGRTRHVTLVFEDDWQAAADALGRAVDPSGRRANVLLSGGGGLRWVGRTVRLGSLLVEIVGETRPCPVMEQAAEGMLEALKPDGRAGVWGRVLEGGTLRPGDPLEDVQGP